MFASLSDGAGYIRKNFVLQNAGVPLCLLISCGEVKQI